MQMKFNAIRGCHPNKDVVCSPLEDWGIGPKAFCELAGFRVVGNDEEEKCYQSSRLRLDADEVGVTPDAGAHDNQSGSVQAFRRASAAMAMGRAPVQREIAHTQRLPH